MIKKLSALLITLGLALSTLVIAGASPASAVDRRACVTLGEFRAVHRPMTFAQTRNVLDGNGTLLTRLDDGDWYGDCVEDRYWDSYEEYDPITDTWNWVDEWVDTTYWDDYAYYVSYIDVVRPTRSAATSPEPLPPHRINFDNYSFFSNYSDAHLHQVRYNPWQLADLVCRFARTGEAWTRPSREAAEAAQAESKPLTPTHTQAQ